MAACVTTSRHEWNRRELPGRIPIPEIATVRRRYTKGKDNETDLHDHWRAQLTPVGQATIDVVTGCQLASNRCSLPTGSAQLADAVGHRQSRSAKIPSKISSKKFGE